ncbi:MAG: hypothetical protein EOM23_06615, partial [Candidatus Moranbacteria bacterium]|nr:hypothetical protein [Candidatus Moranbacteria bacterium]
MGLKNTIAGLDIFSGRQIWKFVLFFFGMVIVAVSLVLSNNFVKSIASQERQRVELWANAVKQRSQLVVDAERLFKSIQDGERKRIGHWASAYEKILSLSHDENIDAFYLEFLEGNNTIPVVITDIGSLEIFASRNLDPAFEGQD